MATKEEAVTRRRSTDARGRAIPLSDDEARIRAEEIIRGLDALDDMGDEAEQRETFEILERAEAEGRLAFRLRPA